MELVTDLKTVIHTKGFIIIMIFQLEILYDKFNERKITSEVRQTYSGWKNSTVPW
jgi:hypothetical protein